MHKTFYLQVLDAFPVTQQDSDKHATEHLYHKPSKKNGDGEGVHVTANG